MIWDILQFAIKLGMTVAATPWLWIPIVLLWLALLMVAYPCLWKALKNKKEVKQ